MTSAVRAGDRDPAPSATPLVAERVARLIRVATVSSGSDPAGDDVFAAFRRELAACYPLVHEHLTVTCVGPRGLLYRWEADEDAGGRPRATGPLVLMAHADVVPAEAGDGWTHPPFAGVIADGAVHGRGALDDKGPLAVIFEAVESLIAEGFRPAAPLLVSLGGDEETRGTGGADAAGAVAASGERPWLVLDEGGAVVHSPLPVVRCEVAMIGVGEKGYATVRLRAAAEPGHASTPARDSAPARLARAIVRLERRPFPARTSAAVRDMLHRFADAAAGWCRWLLRGLALAPAVTARIFAALGGEPAALVRTTCAVTMLEAGTAPNVIAADASATVNLRIAPGETVAGTVRRIRRVVRDREITAEVLLGSEPTPLAPSDGPQFAAMRAAVGESYPEALTTPYLVMATTDARHFHRRWPHVYRFAPIAMSSAQRASIHGVDEHVTIDALERGTRFHRALIRDVLGAAG